MRCDVKDVNDPRSLAQAVRATISPKGVFESEKDAFSDRPVLTLAEGMACVQNPEYISAFTCHWLGTLMQCLV